MKIEANLTILRKKKTKTQSKFIIFPFYIKYIKIKFDTEKYCKFKLINFDIYEEGGQGRRNKKFKVMKR